MRGWSGKLILLATLALLLALLFDWWPALRGGFGWQWPYVHPNSSQVFRLLPGFGVLIVILVGFRLLRYVSLGWWVAWSVISATALPVALLYVLGNPLEVLFLRTISGLTTGGFAIGSTIHDPLATASGWPKLMATLGPKASHIAISPPGWPLLYYGTAQALSHAPILSHTLASFVRPFQCQDIGLMRLGSPMLASSWLGIAAPFWSALAVLPLYEIGRRHLSRSSLQWATLSWIIVPSTAIFTATLSSFYPVVAMLSLLLVWKGITASRHLKELFLIGAGFMGGTALLFNFSFLSILLLAGLVITVDGLSKFSRNISLALWTTIFHGTLLGVGIFVPFGLYWLATGHSLTTIFIVAMNYHLGLERAYWPWLVLHTWDFVLFLGFPLAGLTVIGLTRWRSHPIRTLILAWALTILALLISGTSRGEVGRTWMLLMPFALLCAAPVAVQLPRIQMRVLIGCQILWLLVLVLVLRPVGTGLQPPPVYTDVQQTLPAEQSTRVEATFGDGLILQGYNWSDGEREGNIILNLHWLVQKSQAIPFYFSVLPVGPEGQLLSPTDWQPFDTHFPTTCWPVGKPITDQVKIELMPNQTTELTDWWISLSMFELNTDNQPVRSPITRPGMPTDTQIGLGPIRLSNVRP